MRKSLISKIRRSHGKERVAGALNNSIDPTHDASATHVTSTSHLCRQCKDILSYISKTESGPGIPFAFSHHSTTTTLWESVLNGCHLCSLIWRGGRFSGFRTRDTEKGIDYTVQYSSDDSSVSNITLQVTWQDKMNRSQGGHVEIFDGQIPDFLRHTTTNMVRGNSTGSKGSFETAKEWLRRCQELHPVCDVRQDEQRPRQPSRLILVTETKGKVKLRLCPHSDYAKDIVFYLTLTRD